MELHDYQKRAIAFALHHRRSYMMIDLGLGKTVIALMAGKMTKLPMLVFGPIKPLYNTWPDEIRKWNLNMSYAILHGPNKDAQLRRNVKCYFLPYSSVKWFYNACNAGKFKLRKFFTVYDESTFIKDWTTKRWKQYVKRMLPINSDYRMCLSATPTPNGLIDLWTQFYALDEGKTLGPYPTRYRDRFFHYTGAPRYQTWIKAGSQDQIYQLIKPKTMRLAAKDYLNLPPITYNKIIVDPPKPMIDDYKRLKRDSVMTFEDGMSSTAFSEAALSNKLRQFVQGALYLDQVKGNYKIVSYLKADALKEIVEGLAGQPVLVPIQFKFDYDIICKVFKRQLPVIRGGTSETQSMSLIKQWNEGSLDILLCHPQSIGHGVNLQAGGHNIIWYALPWSLDQFMQLNGRLYRQGQKRGVVVNVLMLNFGIETAVYKVLRNKNATQRNLLDAVKREG